MLINQIGMNVGGVMSSMLFDTVHLICRPACLRTMAET
ncbi:hypothetical protein PAAL109150_15345 [Paenibacillus alkaliterrae]